MANKQNPTQCNEQVDYQTLIENAKSMELENNQLKTIIEKMKAEAAEKTPNDEFAAQIAKLTGDNSQLNEQVKVLIEERDDLANQIKNLKTEIENIGGDNNAEVTALNEQLETAKQQIADLTNKNKDLEEANKEKQTRIDKMLQDASGVDKGLFLSPFAKDLLNLLADKLSKLHGKEIKPETILEDYLIRYNVSEQYNLWFHDFVITEKEAVSIAHKIKPEITNFTQLKKALSINPKYDKHDI